MHQVLTVSALHGFQDSVTKGFPRNGNYAKSRAHPPQELDQADETYLTPNHLCGNSCHRNDNTFTIKQQICRGLGSIIAIKGYHT